MEPKQTTENYFFAVINNIPASYHSCDLRNYFSEFIETFGFICFHFKHRPEVQTCVDVSPTFAKQFDGETESQSKRKTFCCLVKAKQERRKEFFRSYNRKHWLDRKGDSMPSLCYISEFNVRISDSGLPTSKYKTRGELRIISGDRGLVTLAELEKMAELNPPLNVMPSGNVGTPTKVFLDLIKQCKLPPKLIGKLGLSFPKSRSKRRYGNVPFEYGESMSKRKCTVSRTTLSNSTIETVDSDGDNIEVASASGHLLESDTDYILNAEKPKVNVKEDVEANKSGSESDQESVQDEDLCEEWERHEALHDDPANVERNKERLFEEKIELKWEKGGSGLVFYTDAQFWKAKEGGFDEETADDWDVDMSIYYEDNGGDKDSRDLVAMRQEQRRRAGIEATDLKTIGFLKENASIGHFEKYTKAIGRKVMEGSGWTDGAGLGASTSGIAQALDAEGQHPKDKRGLGYYGEKIDRRGLSQAKKVKKDVIISTIYDNPEDIDPEEPLLRRLDPYHLKHRDLSVPYQAFHKPLDPELQVLK